MLLLWVCKDSDELSKIKKDQVHKTMHNSKKMSYCPPTPPPSLSELLSNVPSDFNEDLIELLMFWFNQYKLTSIKSFYHDMGASKVNDLWTNIWFAKGETQQWMDTELEKYHHHYNTYKDYQPRYLYEYIAMIVLYDQIPRNIFRNTQQAYETDHIAFSLAQQLVEHMQYIPIQFNISIIMSFVHQESLQDLKKCRLLIDALENKYPQYNVLTNLNLIYKNHNDRIELFGRVPERNKFFNRPSTEQELIYLRNVNQF